MNVNYKPKLPLDVANMILWMLKQGFEFHVWRDGRIQVCRENYKSLRIDIHRENDDQNIMNDLLLAYHNCAHEDGMRYAIGDKDRASKQIEKIDRE